MLEILQEIDNVKLNFSNDGRLFLNITIALIMFGVALELKMEDFKSLLKNPKATVMGIVSQFVLLPALTFLLAISLGHYITPTIGLGMILVAACPGGNISNFISAISKGNIALSVSLTAFSSVAAIFLTPFNFAFWGNFYIKFYGVTTSAAVRELNVDVADVLMTIVGILGIPLVGGMLFNHYFPKLTDKILIWFKRFSIFAFITILVLIFVSNYETFLNYIQYIFFFVLIHNALAFATGFFSARLAGLDFRDQKTIAIETGIQNSGLALALLFNPSIFPQDAPLGGMAFIAAWWGVWHIVSGLTLASIWSGYFRKKSVAA